MLLKKSVTVKIETGLQARPAANFVQKANKYNADLFIEKDGKRINAKSIMGLMSLAIMNGETILLIADGPDEDEAVENLMLFIAE